MAWRAAGPLHFFPLTTLLLGALIGCTTGTATPASGPSPSGVLNVADAAIAGNDPAMALKMSQSVLATDPNNLDALYHEGAAYYAVGRCEDAIAAYKLALGLDRRSSPAETGIGRCLLKRNAAEAELAFQAAVQDDPGNAAALADLGVARDLQGNYAGATAPYQQSLLISPGVLATEVNLGLSLALSGQAAEALQYLGPLATGSDATPKVREDYALALLAAGRESDARQVLAIDLPPDDVTKLLALMQTAIAASQTAPAPPVIPPAQTVETPATIAPAITTPAAPPATSLEATLPDVIAPPTPPIATAPLAPPTITVAPQLATPNPAAGDTIQR
jgi:Flp pilus assembly protein TadD